MFSRAAILRRIIVLRDSARGEMLFAIADQMLISGATFLIGIATARLLGLDQFGRFTIVLILSALSQAFHNAILVVPMMTLSGRRIRRTQHYYAALMVWNGTLSLLAGLAVALVLFVAIGLRDGVVPWGLLAAAAVYTSTQNFQFTLRRLFFARRKAWQAVILDGSRYALVLAALLAAWLHSSSLSVEGILWALSVSAVLSALPFAGQLASGRFKTRLLRALWFRHYPFARWLMLMTLLTFGQEQVIALALGFALSDEAVGGLRAGQYLLGATHFITMSMENFMPGGAARALGNGGPPALRRYLCKNLVTFGIPTGALILFLALYAEGALRLVFGPGTSEFAPILRIFALSYACIFVRDVTVHYFRAIEHADVIFRAYAASAAVSVLLIYPAIVGWGVRGAALVFMSANVVSTIYLLLAAQQHAIEPAAKNKARRRHQ